MRPDGRHDAALREERQQTNGFDQHGLATGVGTGHKNRELVGMKFEIEWDNNVWLARTVLTPCPPLPSGEGGRHLQIVPPLRNGAGVRGGGHQERMSAI